MRGEIGVEEGEGSDSFRFDGWSSTARIHLGISAFLILFVVLGWGCGGGAFGPGNNGNSGSTSSTPVVVSVGSNPGALAINATTNMIYVAGSPAGTGASGTVTVIDGASNTVTARIPVGRDPGSVAVNEATNTVYAGNNSDNTISVINGANNTLVETFSLRGPCCPANNGIVINPVTNKVYVIDQNNGVTIIQPPDSTNYVVTGNGPGGVVVNPSTNKIYVVNATSQTLTAIDGTFNDATLAVAFPICCPAGAFAGAFRANGMAMNTTTNKIYLSDGNNVAVVDPTTNLFTLVPSPNSPFPVAVNQVTNKIYAANQGGSTVTVIDGTTNVGTQIVTDIAPQAIAINTARDKIYVASATTSSLTVIDGATNSTTRIPVGHNPVSVAVNPTNNKVFVVNANDGTVWVIQQ